MAIQLQSWQLPIDGHKIRTMWRVETSEGDLDIIKTTDPQTGVFDKWSFELLTWEVCENDPHGGDDCLHEYEGGDWVSSKVDQGFVASAMDGKELFDPNTMQFFKFTSVNSYARRRAE